ncbi:tail fiber domain-containing protein [Flavobacterium sp. ACN6]|uniref:tail fiber domain-containing protein n=1 Tax=Flavobacterium sp. ACN6 TaxID=1920426 RepID=UPI000BB2DC7C|nr:tail fiber domain-containing protein [Flavobacterium sp. ACN6]PBJ11870.1 hypothetical protein BSF42_26020 [Flavobacterium sp. ACN6]
MKKLVCLFLLIQSALVIAQTETVVTPNGKKVIIYPAAPGIANNGLTLANNTIKLGGTLTQPTVLTTTSDFTLSIKGLTNGSGDKIVTVDNNGLLQQTWNTGWNTNGNSGTIISNFIGTTDNKDLVFKINNSFAGKLAQGNTAFGYGSCPFTGTGLYNTAIGDNALTLNTTGAFNTALGSQALTNNKTGGSNTGIGALALTSALSASRNTAFGYEALTNLTTGDDNTAVGNNAGSNTTAAKLLKSNKSIYIGNDTSSPSDNVTNQVVIGYGALGRGSNTVQIGNSDMTSIGGAVNWSIGSDLRLKKDIVTSPYGLDFITKLRPVNYKMKTGAQDLQSGFIAQEVELAANSIGYDFNGIVKPQNDKDFYSLRYAEFVVPLVKAVQEQQPQIEALQKEVENKDTKIIELENRLLKLEQRSK